MCRLSRTRLERTLARVDQLTALYESGLVTPSQVAAYGTVDEIRRELIYSLYGADTAQKLALAGQF